MSYNPATIDKDGYVTIDLAANQAIITQHIPLTSVVPQPIVSHPQATGLRAHITPHATTLPQKLAHLVSHASQVILTFSRTAISKAQGFMQLAVAQIRLFPVFRKRASIL